ncbi:oxidoreductase [Mycena leptocephala]|nr:oxidoreductase [Mycena leptocephala]
MQETTHICVVGASGLIGLRHTQHCLAEPLVTLSCIADPAPAGATLAETHGVPYFASVDEMLAGRAAGRVAVDGAILATPSATHVPLGSQLVRAGVHTLVEKPMSTDSARGRQLVAAAAETHTRVLVGHHRRFSPHVVAAKQLLDAGTLGRVLAVQGLWTALKPRAYFEPPTAWRAEAASGGVILINVVHDLDLLRYLLGDVVRVYCERGASTRGAPVEETGALTMVFESGAVGTFVFSDAVASPHNFEAATGENPMIPHKGENVYTFLGTQGTASFPELRVHRYSAGGDWTDEFVTEPAAEVERVPPFTRQLQHFAQVCRGKEEPRCSASEALKTIILVEAVRKSMDTGTGVEVAQDL